MFIKIKLLTCFLLIGWNVLGQEALELYISDAMRNNRQLAIIQLTNEINRQKIESAKTDLLPKLSLNATYTLANGGRNLSFPVGDLLNPVYSALNQLTDTQQFPAIENEEIQFLPNDFHETYIGFKQSVFNSSIYQQIKILQDLEAAGEAQRMAFENQLRHMVTDAWYKALSTKRAIEIHNESIEALSALLEVQKSLFIQHKTTADKVLITEAELQKARSQLSETIQQQISAISYLNFLAGRALDEPFNEDVFEFGFNEQMLDLDSLIEEGIKYRQELKMIQYNRASADEFYKLTKYQSLLPQIYVGAQAGYQGFGYKFDNSQNYTLLQAGLVWNFFNSGKSKKEEEISRIQIQQLRIQEEIQRESISIEIRTAWYKLKAVHESLTANNLEVKAREEALRVMRKKYEADQLPLIELIDSEREYSQARLLANIKQYEYLIRQSELHTSLNSIQK